MDICIFITNPRIIFKLFNFVCVWRMSCPCVEVRSRFQESALPFYHVGFWD